MSYAREDSEAARRSADALRAFGIEVWFDQNELRGGDAWDQKIRKQIKECALFVPIISANTQARREGYFRREWKLAIDRTHDRDDNLPFLVPVVIDDTAEPGAHVPDKFRDVQWTRLLGGIASDAFCRHIQTLLSGIAAGVPTVNPDVADRSRPLAEAAAGRRPALPSKNRSLAAHQWPWFAFTVLLLVGLVLMWRPWRQSPASTPSTTSTTPIASTATAVADNSVAVLAFANLSADKNNGYFSDGISEEICNILGRVPGLRVPATTSSFQFKGKQVAPAEIARQLNVTHLLDGSVQKEGDRVRIRARLINGRDGTPVWSSENYDRDIKDIFKVQDEIAGLIAQQLRSQLRFAFGSDRQVNPEAYQLYLKGRELWSLRTRIPEAKRFFETAIEIDPQFARAYSGLVDVSLVNRRWRRFQRTSPELAKIVAVAEKAVELDSASAEVQVSRGSTFQALWNFSRAEECFRTAIRLNPGYASGYYYLGHNLAETGRMDEALKAFQRASELDPLTSRLLDNYSLRLWEAGRYSAALELAERALALEPNSQQGKRAKQDALLSLGRTDEAVEIARDLARTPSSRSSLTDELVVFTLARAGLRDEAETVMARRTPEFNHTGLIALGREEEFLNALNADVFAVGDITYFLFHPLLDPVRKDPRFERFLAAVNLTEAHDRAQQWRARNPPERARPLRVAPANSTGAKPAGGQPKSAQDGGGVP